MVAPPTNSACGEWGRALSSSSLYAGKGDSHCPRRDNNVASTSNSYGTSEGDSDPPRTDNNVAYTISGQEGRHPRGVVGVDDAGSWSVAGGASSISMHKTRKRQGTYGTRSVAGGASSISMHKTRKRQLNYGTENIHALNNDIISSYIRRLALLQLNKLFSAS